MPMLLGRGVPVESVSLYFHDHPMARLRKNDLVPIDFPEFMAVLAHEMTSSHHEADGTVGYLLTASAAEGDAL